MGNCTPKPPKAPLQEAHPVGSAVAAAPPMAGPAPTPAGRRPPVCLYGPAGCPQMARVRIGLLYKNVAVEFYAAADGPVVEDGGEKVAGSPEAILRRRPAAAGGGGGGGGAAPEHREAPGEDGAVGEAMAAGGGGRPAEGRKGSPSPRMEARKFGRIYSQLAELMMEHAQMEERVVFPVIDRADRDICRAANQEHAKELPIMNGIKEDIKSVVVLDPGGAAHQEALLNLSLRLRLLQERCREHFAEEERELLPLLEELTAEEPAAAVEQLVEVMEATHGHLFNLLISGLLPHEAMQYIEVLCRCRDRQRVAAMLRPLEARLDAAGTTTTKSLGGLLKATPHH
ncbi:unnamed protein product [Spirodela intermedia]|uniref:Hemerythrin-like domain-containing protein n=1 Tax=Spirodela intermedia TaxID=51605 RepID=A0A7I8J0L6_SPIIN|nr:unnamed protein product [Spirodela intermedia]CAA6663755.1 unnamed protein product [Spirodela intermedia]